MICCAVGDALGASFEGAWMRESTQSKLPFGGRWTDDTHMMIGVAESLIANRGFNGEHMAWSFIRNWEKEPWRGYGPGPQRVFRMIRSGVPWNEAAKSLYGGMGSYGNGAAMRVAPVGLLYYDDEKKLRSVAYRSAEITHTHKLGLEGAAVQAYAVASALKERRDSFDPSGFLERIAEFSRSEVYRVKLEKAMLLLDEEDRREVVRGLGNGIEAFNSVPTAIYCFARNHESCASALRYAVSLGGDTDTIGAMTGSIAGAYHEQLDLPEMWRRKLEKGDYIERLAKRLWELKSAER